MPGIPLDKAELLAIFLETFMYGIFFTLFWIAFWILWQKRAGAERNHYLIVPLIFMLVLSTAHLVIDFVRIIAAFIFHSDPALGGPIEYYANISHPLHVAKSVVYVGMSLTGDLVIAWRCYVVYGKSRLIMIVPTVLFIASNVSGSVVCWLFSRASPGSTVFVTAKAWIATFFILTLCTNTYCTGAIVYRIWVGIRFVGGHRKYQLMPVVMTLVESGGLYVSALLALLVTYLLGSNGQFPALDVVTPIVGIVFSLIIIQIYVYSPGMTGSGSNSSWRSGQRTPRNYINRSLTAHPVPVSITVTHHAVHTDHSKSSNASLVDVAKETGQELAVLTP